MYKILETVRVPIINLISGGILRKLCGHHICRIHNAKDITGKVKVTVVGASGKVGQPLCLMLKQSPLIDELCIHDILPTSGLALELSHVDTNCKVTAFTGKENLQTALQDSKLVVLLASAPDADILPVDKKWYLNSQIICHIMTTYVKHCPKSLLAIGTEPINSMVPMCSEILKKHGCFNPLTVFGITSIDTVRANTFVAQCQNLEPECVLVPVIGGHSEETMIPLLSQTTPCAEFTNEELEALTLNIRKAQDNITTLNSKDTAPLSAAFATARFIISVVKGIRGYPDVVEYAFVQSKAHPQLKYMSSPILLGPEGISKHLGIPKLTNFETCMLDNAIPSLMADIKRGEKYVGVLDPAPCGPCDADWSAPKCPQDVCAQQEAQRRMM